MATWTGVARRTTVVFTVLIAVATFVAGTGQAAAGAPPVRTQASTNVVFVHGIDALSAIQFRPPHQDCAADWATMRSEIRTPAPFRSLTFGYYGANTNCDYNVPGNLDTSLNDIARQFSKFISTTFPNQRVDVVAHSMGGLIVRRAISGSQHHEAGFAYPHRGRRHPQHTPPGRGAGFALRIRGPKTPVQTDQPRIRFSERA